MLHSSRFISTVAKSGTRRWSKRIFIAGSSFVLGSAAYAAYEDDDVKQIGVLRFGRAAVAVAKIVADYKLSLRGVVSPSAEYDDIMKQCHLRSAEKLLQLAKDNGGVFIKVGQHLAALEYLVPPEYTKTLSVLMANAPQQSFEDVRYVIESELHQPLESVFSKFVEKPVGAASLAQVHEAVLKESGQRVAVKVQHRRVYKNSKTDISTMEFLVHVADCLFPEFRLMWLVNEVKKNLPNELNFLHEAENAERVRILFRHLPYLKIPHIDFKYSTPKLLLMEFCDGVHVDNVVSLEAAKINKHDVCRRIAQLVSEMIFLTGFLHADPHPGNILINKQENGETEIILLDHGLYLEIDDRLRGLYSNLWMALLNGDQALLKSVANEMGVGEYFGLFACIVARRSWKSVTQGVGQSKMNPREREELREYAVSLIPQISEVLARMPREMLLILKTNDLMRNIEHILGATGRGDSLIQISKCVIRSHYEHLLKRTEGTIARLRINLSLFWSLFRIHSYEYYLLIRDSIGLSAL